MTNPAENPATALSTFPDPIPSDGSVYYDAPGRELTFDEMAGAWKSMFQSYIPEDRVWPARDSSGAHAAAWASPTEGAATLESAELVGILAGLQATIGPTLKVRETGAGVLYVSTGEGQAWRYIPKALMAAASASTASPYPR